MDKWRAAGCFIAMASTLLVVAGFGWLLRQVVEALTIPDE